MKKSARSESELVLIEIAGWYGMIAILIGYALISFQIISSQSFLYHFLNGTGALGLAGYAYHKKDYPTSILNLIFGAIAVIALVLLFRNYWSLSMPPIINDRIYSKTQINEAVLLELINSKPIQRLKHIAFD